MGNDAAGQQKTFFPPIRIELATNYGFKKEWLIICYNFFMLETSTKLMLVCFLRFLENPSDLGVFNAANTRPFKPRKIAKI